MPLREQPVCQRAQRAKTAQAERDAARAEREAAKVAAASAEGEAKGCCGRRWPRRGGRSGGGGWVSPRSETAGASNES